MFFVVSTQKEFFMGGKATTAVIRLLKEATTTENETFFDKNHF